MRPWLRSLVPVALVLGACNDPLPEVTTAADPETSGSTTAPSPPASTTGESTTGVPGTTVASAEVTSEITSDEPPSDTTVGVVETTTGETATSSTSGESSSSTGDPGCLAPEDCGGNETCSDGRCVDACGGAWGMGNYGDCLDAFGDFDTATSCGANHLCVFWGDPIDHTACSLQGCTDACDCPPPPATGDATVTCGQITADPGMNDCYLSCANGETCPDGMSCSAGGVCHTAPPELPVYGDCGNVAADCASPAYCIGVPGGETVCTTSCLNDAACPLAYPPGGNAVPTCTDVVPAEPGSECYLSCVGALSCPNGMTCINGTLCMWQT
jgi:hypothetical protein